MHKLTHEYKLGNITKFDFIFLSGCVLCNNQYVCTLNFYFAVIAKYDECAYMPCERIQLPLMLYLASSRIQR